MARVSKALDDRGEKNRQFLFLGAIAEGVSAAAVVAFIRDRNEWDAFFYLPTRDNRSAMPGVGDRGRRFPKRTKREKHFLHWDTCHISQITKGVDETRKRSAVLLTYRKAKRVARGADGNIRRHVVSSNIRQ